MAEPRIIGPKKIGTGTVIDASVIIGYPSKNTLLLKRGLSASNGAEIGDHCILRSGTVVYEDAIIGRNVQTAHNVIIRERVRVGDACVFGNGAVIREGAILNNNVRLMESVVISEGAAIGNDVFIGPNVTLTAGRYMTGALEASGRMDHQEAVKMEGSYWDGPSVIVEDGVRIGANSVILAGVRLGKDCIVAAGTIVSIDIPAGSLVAGNPARILKRGSSSNQ